MYTVGQKGLSLVVRIEPETSVYGRLAELLEAGFNMPRVQLRYLSGVAGNVDIKADSPEASKIMPATADSPECECYLLRLAP